MRCNQKRKPIKPFVSLRVATLNVGGLQYGAVQQSLQSWEQRIDAVFSAATDGSPDVVLLQEVVHSMLPSLRDAASLRGYVFPLDDKEYPSLMFPDVPGLERKMAVPTDSYFTLTAVKCTIAPLKIGRLGFINSMMHRDILGVELTLPGASPVLVLNVHLESLAAGATMRKEQLALLEQLASCYPACVVGGDTNLRDSEDSSIPTMFVDAASSLGPEVRKYTWRSDYAEEFGRDATSNKAVTSEPTDHWTGHRFDRMLATHSSAMWPFPEEVITTAPPRHANFGLLSDHGKVEVAYRVWTRQDLAAQAPLPDLPPQPPRVPSPPRVETTIPGVRLGRDREDTVPPPVVDQVDAASAPSDLYDEESVERLSSSLAKWRGNAMELNNSDPDEMLSLPPLSAEQQAVLDYILSPECPNVFITGSAGTGKSVLLRAIINALPKSSTFVTAATGIAALPLKGETLHSWSGYSSTSEAARAQGMRRKRDNYDRCKVLIIDEVSMVHPEMFECIEKYARRVKRGDLPFGGIQVIVCGDFLQLPPVDKENPTEGPTFAFETEAWKNMNMKTCLLSIVHRQSGDNDLVRVLAEVRKGEISAEGTKLLASRDASRVPPIDLAEASGKAVCLRSTKYQVSDINTTHFKRLKGTTVRYVAQDSGVAAHLLDDYCRAPRELWIKVGCRVMLLQNLSIAMGLVNGACGEVIGFLPSHTADFNVPETSRLLGRICQHSPTLVPVIRFDAHCGAPSRTVLIEPKIWTLDQAGGSVTAERIQLPLCLAWAMTIHKSQGLTLDCYDVSTEKTFSPGQAYVALSRGRSLSSVILRGFHPSQVRAHPKAVAFYDVLQNQPKPFASFLPHRERVEEAQSTGLSEQPSFDACYDYATAGDAAALFIDVDAEDY